MPTRIIESPVGPLFAESSERGLASLLFDSSAPADNRPCPHVDLLETELAAYFSGRLKHFGVPLDLRGTDFDRSVWSLLLQIPFGTAVSYGELAAKLAKPGGARAVGHANGRNPVAIVVPCHRVVQSDGSLGGYGGGLERKRFLLELEGARTENPLFAAARGFSAQTR